MRMLHRQNKTQTRDRRSGVSMVEFSLVLPVFLLILFAGFEFARICLVRNAANNPAYQAARQVMVPGATVANANTEVTRILSVFGVRQFTLTVNPSPITLTTDQVTVTIDIPANQCGWITPMFTDALVIHAGSTLFAERDRSY